MRRAGWIGWLILIIWANLLLPERVAAMAEEPPVGKIVSIQGQVAVQRAGSKEWELCQVDQPLMAGDSVRTGPNSRAAILCVDESQIKLNENTVVIMKSISPSPRLQPITPAKEKPPAPPSRYEVPQGEIWLRNKHEKFRFELETPAVTATIRGTELNIKVQRNGTTSVILLEGNVCLTNPQGEVCLRPGEEGYTIPGQKPTKRLLVQPADAVQWVLYYPGLISYRDLPLSSLSRPATGPSVTAQLIQEGEAAYDQGRLQEAKGKAQEVLAKDPENSRALTLLGWVNLQEYQPDEALTQFRRVRQPDDLTAVGQALALENLGDAVGAYEFISKAGQKAKPSPLLAVMFGYFSLLAGRVEEARSRLAAALALPPPAPRLARPLLAQIELVQNRKDAAQAVASQALAQAPESPMALFTMGLVKMAAFDLHAATRNLQKAIDADPHFVYAYVYLAKIWLGSEYLSRAQKTIDRALKIAPRDPAVLSLAGFIRLACRDYAMASSLFNRAVRADPRFGEPHLGLAIYSFRYREFHRGLEEMLTATLLDPRVASYQTELGKALFQTRAFDRALEVYEYAKTLDPKDPTPYFYRGIALSDLNRAGEAVQEINKSIELNDNVAMFRSRSLLDQDLAVRNYSLAKSYQQLGLNEWALSKAVTAVKYNPYDSSAHLFLSQVITGARSQNEIPLLNGGMLLSTQATEGALFRVLSRANQATFSNVPLEGTEALGFTTDYSQMFEMLYGRVAASAGIGTWEGSKSIQEYQGLIYGGAPGMAAAVFGKYADSRGSNFPTAPVLTPDSFGGSQRIYDIQGVAKWEPTVKGTLSAFLDLPEQKVTDHGTMKVPPQPPYDLVNINFADNLLFRPQFYEVAYYHRFNPESASLLYYSRLEYPFHQVSTNTQTTNIDIGFGPPGVPATDQNVVSQTFDRSRNNIQFQQYQRLSFLGQHSLIGGFDYLTGGPGISQRYNATEIQTLFTSPPFVVPLQTQTDSRSPQWNYSFYLLDYWRPYKNLVLELGLFKDFNKTVIPFFQDNVYQSTWSPRLGVNYQFRVNGTQHVLRAAVGRFMNNHFLTQPLLVPSETAGFPFAVDSRSGTEIRQAGGSWEAQWDPKTFTVLRLAALRLATPSFLTLTDPNTGTSFDQPIWETWKRYQASLILNRILCNSLGLSAGVMGKRVIPDLGFESTNILNFTNLRGYSEFNAFIGLAYLHPQGWLARIKPLLVQQYGDITGHKADNPFVMLNLTFGRDFPNKRGFALFEIQNLLNRRPFYTVEPDRDLEFSNNRRFLFRLGLYF